MSRFPSRSIPSKTSVRGLAECLRRGLGIAVSQETLRKLMMRAGVRKPQIPEIVLIAGTRVTLGIGLLVSGRLNDDQRKAAGWTLLAVGILTTIPIVRGVRAKPTAAVV